VEGWDVFLERLEDDGLLAVSRAVSPELGRLVALGRAAPPQGGSEEPGAHMVLITNPHRTELSVYPMGVLLVRKSPSARTSSRASRAARQMNFEIEVATRRGAHAAPACTRHRRDAQVVAASGLDYDAPTGRQAVLLLHARARQRLRLLGGSASPAAAPPWCSRRCWPSSRPDAGVHRVAAGARGERASRGATCFACLFRRHRTGFMLIEVSMLSASSSSSVIGLRLTVLLFVLLLCWWRG